ncbi:MAG: hypothetical protein LBL08_01045 [Candidatus Nomurabacteria bacterium]|jgi:pyruvate,water dikinase|nr:hypothetical protein [Candidatus Nomurabacteria bacterium]
MIKTFQEIKDDEIGLVGGKGLSLSRMIRADLPVPDGFVITTKAYGAFARGDVDDDSWADFAEKLLQAFENLGTERVAVRSSAIAEDSPNASWAGQFESFLNVRRDDLLDSVKKCWDSAKTHNVASYADEQDIKSDELALAVVVQKMVASEKSGVAFSVNPLNKNTDEIMIEAIYGLGELIVQGMITPDDYVVDKNSFQILDKTIAAKRKMMVYENGENIEEDVEAHLAEEQCLDDEDIIKLAQIIIDVEKFYNTPQDIEWAVEAGSFYVVQSRPITTL